LTLNPYMSLLNLKLCSHIWSTNINFRPPYTGLFGPSWSELSPWAGDKFFCHRQKCDYLSRASQRARGTTKNCTCVCKYAYHSSCTSVIHNTAQKSSNIFILMLQELHICFHLVDRV